MSEKSDLSRAFEPVEDPKDAELLLREAAKAMSPVIIWTHDQAQMINTHVTMIGWHDKTIYTWIPPDFDPKAFKTKLEDAGTKECFFSISLARANIFFKTLYRYHDRGGLQFHLPVQIYKVQRRKDMRFPIQPPYKIIVSFDDPTFPDRRMSRTIFDVSASGMSILLEEDDAPLFPMGAVINNLSFTLRDRILRANGEVRHRKDTKVGILFKGMAAVDSQYIAAFVFEESRKYFSRFMG